jgi:hypothetical protein
VIVSNTEVTMYNTCRRQHYYRFGLNIEPRFNNLGPALVRGLVGHSALDSYYESVKAGYSHDDAVEMAFITLNQKLQEIVTQFPDSTDLIKIIAKVKSMLEGYFRLYRNDSFIVHEVEGFFSAPITDTALYGMRLDLLIEYTSGEYRGDFVVVDHKFVYNFKTPKELAMDGQLSKYVKTLRSNGYVVTKGMFNQLRYRELKDPTEADLYRRTPVKASFTKANNIWKEQAKCTTEISEVKAQPKEVWSETATRNLSPFTCKYCHFQELCEAELNEQDITKALQANYQKNTYGYADLALEE